MRLAKFLSQIIVFECNIMYETRKCSGQVYLIQSASIFPSCCYRLSKTRCTCNAGKFAQGTELFSIIYLIVVFCVCVCARIF